MLGTWFQEICLLIMSIWTGLFRWLQYTFTMGKSNPYRDECTVYINIFNPRNRRELIIANKFVLEKTVTLTKRKIEKLCESMMRHYIDLEESECREFLRVMTDWIKKRTPLGYAKETTNVNKTEENKNLKDVYNTTSQWLWSKDRAQIRHVIMSAVETKMTIEYDFSK